MLWRRAIREVRAFTVDSGGVCFTVALGPVAWGLWLLTPRPLRAAFVWRLGWELRRRHSLFRACYVVPLGAADEFVGDPTGFRRLLRSAAQLVG